MTAGLIIAVAVTGNSSEAPSLQKFLRINWKDSLTIGALMNT
jgi:hypothetical protein